MKLTDQAKAKAKAQQTLTYLRSMAWVGASRILQEALPFCKEEDIQEQTRFVEKLGEGSSGTVCLVSLKADHTGYLIAMKVTKPSADPISQENFSYDVTSENAASEWLNNAITMAQCPHFNMTFRACFNLQPMQGWPFAYFFQELAKTTFYQLAKGDAGAPSEYYVNGLLADKLVVSILFQVCWGLTWMQQYDLLHNDLSPSNVFLSDIDRNAVYQYTIATGLGSQTFLLPTFGSLAKLADYGRVASVAEQPIRNIPRQSLGDLLLAPSENAPLIPLAQDRIFKYDLLYLLSLMNKQTYWTRNQTHVINIFSLVEPPAQRWLSYMLGELERRPIRSPLDFRNFCFGEMFQPSLLASMGIHDVYHPSLEDTIVTQVFTL